MKHTIEFFGLIILIWMVAYASAPIQWLKELLNVHPRTKSENVIVLAIMKLVNCSLCVGFWVGLGFYQDVLKACILSFCAEVFSRICHRYL